MPSSFLHFSDIMCSMSKMRFFVLVTLYDFIWFEYKIISIVLFYCIVSVFRYIAKQIFIYMHVFTIPMNPLYGGYSHNHWKFILCTLFTFFDLDGKQNETSKCTRKIAQMVVEWSEFNNSFTLTWRNVLYFFRKVSLKCKFVTIYSCRLKFILYLKFVLVIVYLLIGITIYFLWV